MLFLLSILILWPIAAWFLLRRLNPYVSFAISAAAACATLASIMIYNEFTAPDSDPDIVFHLSLVMWLTLTLFAHAAIHTMLKFFAPTYLPKTK